MKLSDYDGLILPKYVIHRGVKRYIIGKRYFYDKSQMNLHRQVMFDDNQSVYFEWQDIFEECHSSGVDIGEYGWDVIAINGKQFKLIPIAEN